MRLESYDLVLAAIVLAMLPWSPHCLVGIPAGIWGLWKLSRPEVGAAFVADLRRRPRVRPRPQRAGPLGRKVLSFLRSFRSLFLSLPPKPSTTPLAPPPTPAPEVPEGTSPGR